MSHAIAFKKDTDLSGLRLEKTVNGNVASPWFSFAIDPTEPVYAYGSRYHAIVAQSKDAFASILGIDPREVLVSEKKEGAEIWWRLGTRHPCELPKPKKKPSAQLDAGLPVIDI